MLARIRKHVTYANVVSSLALFLAISGGVAWAALARNSVGPKQIQKGAVREDEIAKGAVGSSEIAKDAVGKSEVAADAIRSPEVRNRSLLGVDIRQLTLNKIPVGRSDATGGCNPVPTIVANCAGFDWAPPREGPVLLIAALDWHTTGDTAPTQALCQIQVDGVPVGLSMQIGELGPDEDTDSTHTRTAATTAISDPVSTDEHDFKIGCEETDGQIDIGQASLSAVLMGDGSDQ